MTPIEFRACLREARKRWMSVKSIQDVTWLGENTIRRRLKEDYSPTRDYKSTFHKGERLRNYLWSQWIKNHDWEFPAKQMVDKLKTTVEEREAPEVQPEQEKEIEIKYFYDENSMREVLAQEVNDKLEPIMDAVESISEHNGYYRSKLDEHYSSIKRLLKLNDSLFYSFLFLLIAWVWYIIVTIFW